MESGTWLTATVPAFLLRASGGLTPAPEPTCFQGRESPLGTVQAHLSGSNSRAAEGCQSSELRKRLSWCKQRRRVMALSVRAVLSDEGHTSQRYAGSTTKLGNPDHESLPLPFFAEKNSAAQNRPFSIIAPARLSQSQGLYSCILMVDEGYPACQQERVQELGYGSGGFTGQAETDGSFRQVGCCRLRVFSGMGKPQAS